MVEQNFFSFESFALSPGGVILLLAWLGYSLYPGYPAR